jgi:biotin transport system permease protein
MTTVGLFVPGTSVVHRLPASVKLLLLVAAGAASFLVRQPWQAGVALALALLGHLAARIPLRLVAAQVRPLIPVLVVVGLLQVLVNGWRTAAVVVGVLAALVLVAGLVTLTTRTSDLVDVLVRALRPWRRLGLDPERVGLLLALSVRSVAVVVGLAREVREAQRARGKTASPRAYAVPLLIRSLRHADELGEALVARGVDD